jgi:hypothetical protein
MRVVFGPWHWAEIMSPSGDMVAISIRCLIGLSDKMLRWVSLEPVRMSVLEEDKESIVVTNGSPTGLCRRPYHLVAVHAVVGIYKQGNLLRTARESRDMVANNLWKGISNSVTLSRQSMRKRGTWMGQTSCTSGDITCRQPDIGNC